MSPTPAADERLRHVLSALGHLGWALRAGLRPEPLDPRGPSANAWSVAVQVPLAMPGGEVLLLVAREGEMAPIGQAFRRFEDLTSDHRELLALLGARAMRARYVLAMAGARAHLLDATEEDVLVATESPEEFTERLLPLLDVGAVTRGSLDAFPRKTLHQRARELGEWAQLWTMKLGARLEPTPSLVARVVEALLVARLASGVGYAELNPGPSLAVVSATTRRADWVRAVTERWHLAQDVSPRLLEAFLDEAARSGLLHEMLESLALLGTRKFTADVFAEALADEPLRLLSWRASVVGDPLIPAGSEADSSLLSQTFEIDLDRAGTAVLLRGLDELASFARERALDWQAATERGERPGVQLDLLAAEAPRLDVRGVVGHVVRGMIRVRSSQPARAALARLLVVARALEWQARLGAGPAPLPRVAVTSPPVSRAVQPARHELAIGDPQLN